MPETPRYRKPHLPTKTCVVCGRPFAWRKKWARDWDAISTCSDRCRGERRRAARAADGPETPGGAATDRA